MNISEAKTLAENALRDLESMEITVRDANKAFQKLDKAIIDAESDLRRKKNDNTYPENFAFGIIQSMKNSEFLPVLLIEMIDQAAETNTEFERSAYKGALYKVAKDKDIYKMITRGQGWGTTLAPQIVFEEEAGDLNDWAEAIEAYRDDLDVKIGNDRRSKRGEKATNFWIQRVFGTGLEVITINERLGYSNGLAPFWRILNNGSQPLASDRPDNSYNPLPATPTDFIGDAERAIAREFRTFMNREKERWFDEVDQMQAEIDNARDVKLDMLDAIERLTPRKAESRNFLQRLLDGIAYHDSDALQQAEKDLRVGPEFDKPAPQDTDVNIIKKAGSFLKGAFKKAIRKVRGFDD